MNKKNTIPVAAWNVVQYWAFTIARTSKCNQFAKNNDPNYHCCYSKREKHKMQLESAHIYTCKHTCTHTYVVVQTGGHFVCLSVDVPRRHFFVNCLRSLPVFAGCFLELNDVGVTFHKSVLKGIDTFLRWKWVYCNLAVTLERTVFPFLKRYIKATSKTWWRLKGCYDLAFRAHFLSNRKRSVW